MKKLNVTHTVVSTPLGKASRAATRLAIAMLLVLSLGSAARADVVLDWNAIAINTAIANGQSPFAQARFAAIAQLAVFEAVNAEKGD